MKNIIALICVFTIQSLWAQKQDSSKTHMAVPAELRGFIITQKGDTVYGKFRDRRGVYGYEGDYIEMSHPDLFYKYVLFSGSSAAKTRKYTPAEIRGFKISGSEFYYTSISEDIKAKKAVFARPISEGIVSLYARRMPSTKLPQAFFLKKGFEIIHFKANDKQEKIAVFFDDNPELHARILKGDFTNNSEDIIILVNSYNDWFNQTKKK